MKRRSKQGTASKPQPSNPTAQRKLVAPQTTEEYFALREEERDLWSRSTHVITKMRTELVSLPVASGEFGLNPATVVQLVGSALRRNARGQYVAKARDRLLRVLVIPVQEGIREIATRDSRQASQLATYWVAVQKYLETGDSSELSKFEGMYITDANGTKVSLITDLEELDRMGSAGVLSFESLYTGVA